MSRANESKKSKGSDSREAVRFNRDYAAVGGGTKGGEKKLIEEYVRVRR